MSNLNKNNGSELDGHKLGDKDLGLKAHWAGRDMGPDIIAPFSKGRQYDGAEHGDKHRRAAPQRTGGSLTKDSTGSGMNDHYAMNDWSLRNGSGKKSGTWGKEKARHGRPS